MSLDREKTELQETGSAMLPRRATVSDLWQIVTELGIDPARVRVEAPNGGYVYLEHEDAE